MGICFIFLFGHAFVIVCFWSCFDQVEIWCLRVPSLHQKATQLGTPQINSFILECGHFLVRESRNTVAFPLHLGRLSTCWNVVAEYGCWLQWGPAVRSVRHRIGHIKNVTCVWPLRLDACTESKLVGVIQWGWCCRMYDMLSHAKTYLLYELATCMTVTKHSVWLKLGTFVICQWITFCFFFCAIADNPHVLIVGHMFVDNFLANTTKLWKCWWQRSQTWQRGTSVKKNWKCFICCVSVHSYCMHRFDQSTTPWWLPCRIDLFSLFTWWTSIRGTHHKIIGFNMPRKQANLRSWPKPLSYDANSVRPSSRRTIWSLRHVFLGLQWKLPGFGSQKPYPKTRFTYTMPDANHDLWKKTLIQTQPSLEWSS